MDRYFQPGNLFVAKKTTNAIKTDPWTTTEQTITYVDHTMISPGEVVMLIDYQILGKVGNYIWLLGDKIVWQILKNDLFAMYWGDIKY